MCNLRSSLRQSQVLNWPWSDMHVGRHLWEWWRQAKAWNDMPTKTGKAKERLQANGCKHCQQCCFQSFKKVRHWKCFGGFMEKEIQLPAHLAELRNTCICYMLIRVEQVTILWRDQINRYTCQHVYVLTHDHSAVTATQSHKVNIVFNYISTTHP